MEEKFDVLEMFRVLKKIKKQENFRIALMSKEELINYVVEQMEFVEQNFPDMVVHFDDEPIGGEDPNDGMDRR